MIEPELGFDIDGVLYRWGTLPGEITGIGQLPLAVSFLHRDLPCRSIFDLAAAGVMVSAPAVDRPVMTVTYELAAPSLLRAQPDRWLKTMRSRLGAPAEEGKQSLRDYRDPSAGVASWARWQRPTIGLHMSIYGGVRRAAFGRSAAMLAFSWTDTAAAAAPFVAQWRAETAALVQSAATALDFRRFEMPLPLTSPGDPVDQTIGSWENWRALNSRTLLATPVTVAKGLSTRSFAIWQSAGEAVWAFSTAWDTIVLRPTTQVLWIETKPAKGGGQSCLSIDRLSIAMPYGTEQIAAAAAALAALPGLRVEKVEDYDA
jgi:hypothetical protein